MVRILANENVAGDVVEQLRRAGHNVVWIRTDSPGASDEANLSRGVAEQRLLITFDKDFGELVFHRGRAGSCGVMLFRISMPSAEAVAKRVVAVVGSRADWAGYFTVIDDHRLRMVPLPSPDFGKSDR